MERGKTQEEETNIGNFSNNTKNDQQLTGGFQISNHDLIYILKPTDYVMSSSKNSLAGS